MINDIGTELQWLYELTARIHRLQQAEEYLRRLFQPKAEETRDTERDGIVSQDEHETADG